MCSSKLTGLGLSAARAEAQQNVSEITEARAKQTTPRGRVQRVAAGPAGRLVTTGAFGLGALRRGNENECSRLECLTFDRARNEAPPGVWTLRVPAPALGAGKLKSCRRQPGERYAQQGGQNEPQERIDEGPEDEVRSPGAKQRGVGHKTHPCDP